jgi:hypothetical protein
MGANSLWQQAVDWWAGRQNAGGSGGSSQGGEPVKATKGERFDKELSAAKVRYERGTYDVNEYLAELRRLRRAYQFAKHSPRGMALWREMQRAEDGRRDLMKGNQGDPDAPDRPPREPGAAPGGPSSTNRMGGAGAGSGGNGGVTLVINAPNAVMVDRKAVQEVFDRYAPQIQKALAKHRNGAG